MTNARTLADNFAADINAVTAGTGITGGGTSGTVTVTNSMATAIDAKGDLVVGTGADAFSRLAVGATNGHTLQVDSGEATGMKWAAASGGGGISYTLLNSPSGTALTGAATITISSISGKEYLVVLIEDASSANVSSQIRLRINTDTASNYAFMGLTNIAGSTYSNTQTINATGTSPNSGDTHLPFGTMDNNAGSGVYGSALILGGTSTGIKSITIAGSGYGVGTQGQRQHAYTGIYKASAAITSISINSSSGNFDGGTVWVYGA